jgi:hypothetical protein
MEYIIVTGKFLEDLVKIVNKKIQEGYRPQGSVNIDPYSYFMQAMIKE